MWTTGLTTYCLTCGGLGRRDVLAHIKAVERNMTRYGMEHPFDPMPHDEYVAKVNADAERKVARIAKVVKPVLDRTVFGVMWPIGG